MRFSYLTCDDVRRMTCDVRRATRRAQCTERMSRKEDSVAIAVRGGRSDDERPRLPSAPQRALTVLLLAVGAPLQVCALFFSSGFLAVISASTIR